MVKRHVLNKLMLLRFIQLAKEVKGATRLQKMVFKTESVGRGNNKPTFNYKFIRWHYGPYSEELKNDLQFLKENNLIKIDNNTFALTSQGENNIKNVEYLFKELGIDTLLTEVVKEYNDMNLNKLLREIYTDFAIESDFEKGNTIFPIIDDESGELSNAKDDKKVLSV